jgi:hypothetical protein
VSNFLLKDLPALLRLTGISAKRCPEISDWYKRTEIVQNQKDLFLSGKSHPSQISAALDIIVSKDENMVERRGRSDDATMFFVNSSRNLYQDEMKNRVTVSRIKAFESKTMRTETWDDAVFECLSLHVVQKFETETGPVYLCDCKGFKVRKKKFWAVFVASPA